MKGLPVTPGRFIWFPELPLKPYSRLYQLFPVCLWKLSPVYIYKKKNPRHMAQFKAAIIASVSAEFNTS